MTDEYRALANLDTEPTRPADLSRLAAVTLPVGETETEKSFTKIFRRLSPTDRQVILDWSDLLQARWTALYQQSLEAERTAGERALELRSVEARSEAAALRSERDALRRELAALRAAQRGPIVREVTFSDGRTATVRERPG